MCMRWIKKTIKLGPDFDYSKLEEDVKQTLCMRENNCDQRNWEEEEGQL